MSEIGVTLRISKVGDREALAALDSLDRTGRRVVENVSGFTGRAMGDIAAAYRKAGEAGQDAFRKLSAQAEIANMQARSAASSTKELAASQEKAGIMAGAHGLQLGRMRMELGTLLGRLTGTNTALDRMGGALGAMAIGDPLMIGALAGVAALAAGYEYLTKNARESEKALADVRKRAAAAANAGKADDLQEMARQLTFGTPFTGEGKNLKMMAVSSRVKGAFSGSIADLQAQRGELQQMIANAPNMLVASRFAQQEKKLDAVLNPLLERLAAVRAASENLASQPSDSAGKIAGMSVSALSDDAIAKRADKQEKAADKAAKAYAKALHKLNIANAKVEADAEVEATALRKQREAERSRGIQQSLASMQAALAQNFATSGGANTTWLDGVQKMAEQMERSISKTIGDALANGFETAFTSLSLGDGFKALTASVLSGIGSMMESVGASMVSFGTLVEWFKTALIALNGGNMVLAGIEMIAAGALLKSASGAISGSIGSRGGGGGAGSGSLGQIVDRGVVGGSYSTTDPRTVQPRPSIVMPVFAINPADGATQRLVDETLRKINQNGSLAGGR